MTRLPFGSGKWFLHDLCVELSTEACVCSVEGLKTRLRLRKEFEKAVGGISCHRADRKGKRRRGLEQTCVGHGL